MEQTDTADQNAVGVDLLYQFSDLTYARLEAARTHALTSAYGLTYTPNDYLSYTTAPEVGTIQDNFENDCERRALTLGVKYQSEALTFSGTDRIPDRGWAVVRQTGQC